MSRPQQNRLRLASEIERYGVPLDLACDRCSLTGHFCVAMEDSLSRLKCSEWVRADKLCVNMFWFFLDRTREELFSKVAENEALLATVINRLLRNKKILKEIDQKATQKTQYLLNSVNESILSKLFNCSAVAALIETSSVF